jgi:hypothetical protein
VPRVALSVKSQPSVCCIYLVVTAHRSAAPNKLTAGDQGFYLPHAARCCTTSVDTGLQVDIGDISASEWRQTLLQTQGCLTVLGTTLSLVPGGSCGQSLSLAPPLHIKADVLDEG